MVQNTGVYTKYMICINLWKLNRKAQANGLIKPKSKNNFLELHIHSTLNPKERKVEPML